MSKHTPLYDQHVQAGAKMVEFAGWSMPLHYGSQMEEHHHVRRGAGVFDVSHMTVIDVLGKDARLFLSHLLANDVGKLMPGRAMYSCMLNEAGGIIDDLIVYHLAPDSYRLVVNAGTAEKDLVWIRQHSASHLVELHHRTDLAILAIQGPQALANVEGAQAMRPFDVIMQDEICVARTGYTGEDGVEIILPPEQARSLWTSLVTSGACQPCGLGARDTLRLEAGLNLYGTDMDENTSPLVSNLGWTVAWEPTDRDFIGRAALVAQRGQVSRQLVGLVLMEQGGIPRSHQKVIVPDIGEGEITSGTFSPTLQRAIAFARVPVGVQVGTRCFIMIRDKQVSAHVVKPPFVRHGRQTIGVLNDCV